MGNDACNGFQLTQQQKPKRIIAWSIRIPLPNWVLLLFLLSSSSFWATYTKQHSPLPIKCVCKPKRNFRIRLDHLLNRAAVRSVCLRMPSPQSSLAVKDDLVCKMAIRHTLWTGTSARTVSHFTRVCLLLLRFFLRSPSFCFLAAAVFIVRKWNQRHRRESTMSMRTGFSLCCCREYRIRVMKCVPYYIIIIIYFDCVGHNC